MPIIGIVASSKLVQAGSYDSIATTNVGAGGTPSVTFSSIPSTYKHLQIRITVRTSVAAVQDDLLMRFNGDTGNNYAGHQLFGNGSSVGNNPLGGTPPVNLMYPGYISGNTSASGTYGVAIIDILDYADANKYKVFRSLNGNNNNGSGFVLLRSGLYMNTSAISTVSFTLSGANYMEYSSFALYGIKGS